MKKKIFWLALAVLAAVGAFYLYRQYQKNEIVTEDRVAPPQFGDYKAADAYKGKPAAPDFQSQPDALRFKTAIEKGALEGPNFAGHYTVVSWGCGSSCQSHAILDAETGKIVFFGNDFVTTREVKYEIGSRLIIFDPYSPDINPASEEYDFPAKYFVLNNGKLDKIYEEGCVLIQNKLECGENFYGYIRSISPDGNSLDIDNVEFLSGAEAAEKGAQDSGCAIERVADCIPSLNNDFYIRNVATTTARYSIGAGALIRTEASQGSPSLAEITASELKSQFSNSNFLKQALFRFVRQGNVLLKIEQQYTP